MEWADQGAEQLANSQRLTAYFYLAGLMPLHLLRLPIAINGRKHLAKTLILLAPNDVGTDRGKTLLSKAIRKMLGKNSAEAEKLMADQSANPASQSEAIGFMLHGGEPEILWVDNQKQYTYLVTVRRFLRLLPNHDLKAIPSGASDET